MYILSMNPYVEVSLPTLKYLILERRWLEEDRPRELLDQLDDLWYAMDDTGFEFLSDRGLLDHDSNIFEEGGNGFQFSMLDAVPEFG